MDNCRHRPFTILSLGLILVAASWAAADIPPSFHLMWGSQCDTSVSGVDGCDGLFNGAVDVAIGASGLVYVVDQLNERIQVFNSSGTYISKWGSIGALDGEFSWPQAAALDTSGNVYVADGNNHRIQKFDSGGTLISKWGTYGSGNTELDFPAGIAIDDSDVVYVTEFYNHRVHKFSSAGLNAGQWGAQCEVSVQGVDGCDNGFNYPWGVAVDASGNVYVADSGNDRIMKFTSSGTFITRWGVTGTGDSEFDSPSGVAVDAAGNVYVADRVNDRIQKFAGDGTFLTKWGSHSLDGPAGTFYYPTGLTFDLSGNLFIAESSNNRVQRFGDPYLEVFVGEPDLPGY